MKTLIILLMAFSLQANNIEKEINKLLRAEYKQCGKAHKFKDANCNLIGFKLAERAGTTHNIKRMMYLHCSMACQYGYKVVEAQLNKK